jgi:hypothetical protein
LTKDANNTNIKNVSIIYIINRHLEVIKGVDRVGYRKNRKPQQQAPGHEF